MEFLSMIGNPGIIILPRNQPTHTISALITSSLISSQGAEDD